MEIDFNPSQLAKPELSQPVPRQGAAPSSSDGGSFIAAASLHDKFDSISLVRPERLETARILAADMKYPPDYALDRIALLLANHLSH
jgi:hypothetical protein